MKTACVILLAITVLATAVFASEPTSARVVAVKKYDHGRIAYWEGIVPIYDNYPPYDITIQVGQKHYIVRYESLTGYYPSAWKVGNLIQVKKERGRFILINGEDEVPARTVSQQDCILSTSPPTVLVVGAQLPCE